MGTVQSMCEPCFVADDGKEKLKPSPNKQRINARDKPKFYTSQKSLEEDETFIKIMSQPIPTPSTLSSSGKNGHKRVGTLGQSLVKKRCALETIQEDDNKKLSINDFRLIKVLGRGSFGKVYFAKKVTSKKPYAIKTVKKKKLKDTNNTVMAMNEKNILQSASHPFVVKLHYSFQNQTTLYYVMDFCAGGELFLHLKQRGKFTEQDTLFYVAETILGLEYLHKELGIIYRDLKPENILLDSNGHIKITDFGLAKMEGNGRSLAGTPIYIAPEIIQKKEYTQVVDWWSLGCLMYEMLCGYPPFSSNDVKKLYKLILTTEVIMPVMISKTAIDLISKLLNKNPEQRLGFNGAEEIKKHAFFKDLNWDDVAKLKVRPPIVPTFTRADDLKNFPKKLLNEPAAETPCSKKKSSAGDQFAKFTFVRKELEESLRTNQAI